MTPTPQDAGLIERARANAGITAQTATDRLLIELADALEKALSQPSPVQGEAVEIVRREASLLLQQAEGCAANHYGEDFALHGMPGWLADTRANLEKALTALASPAPAEPGWRDAALILLARLHDFEQYLDSEDASREFYGHVSPAVARLRTMLAAAPARGEG